MVQRDKQLAGAIITLASGAIYLLLIGYGVFTFAATSSTPYDGAYTPIFAGILAFYVAIFALPFGVTIAQLRSLLRQDERRRQAQIISLQHRQSLVGQPKPVIAGAQLPMTIRLIPRAWVLVGAISSSALTLAGCVGIYLTQSYLLDTQHHAEILAALFVLTVLAFWSAIAFWLVFSVARQTITITPNGVFLRRQRFNGMIHWHEAQLFAQVRVQPMRAQSRWANQLELAHAFMTLRWLHLTRPNPTMKPESMTWDDYQRQMSLVIQVIGANTGLPLVDVR